MGALPRLSLDAQVVELEISLDETREQYNNVLRNSNSKAQQRKMEFLTRNLDQLAIVQRQVRVRPTGTEQRSRHLPACRAEYIPEARRRAGGEATVSAERPDTEPRDSAARLAGQAEQCKCTIRPADAGSPGETCSSGGTGPEESIDGRSIQPWLQDSSTVARRQQCSGQRQRSQSGRK